MIFSVLPTCLLFCLSAVSAAPTSPAGTHNNNASVTTATFDNLVRFEQFCAAVYCTPNFDGDLDTKLRCPVWYDNSTSCPEVEAADTTVVAKFENTGESGLTGYVAHDHTNKLTVVAFRGTQSIRNYWADFQISLVDTDLCEGCQAHEGYWKSWYSSRHLVLPAVHHATKLQPNYSLVVTGHSLGGAQATLCAADLRNRDYVASLYAYGCPRVVDPNLAFHIGNQTGGTFRVTHLNDPVPKLPTAWEGFQHIQPEYYIDSATNCTNTTAQNVIGPLYGIDNPLGNAAQPLITDGEPFFAPHTWYLGNTTACVNYVALATWKRGLEVELEARDLNIESDELD